MLRITGSNTLAREANTPPAGNGNARAQAHGSAAGGKLNSPHDKENPLD